MRLKMYSQRAIEKTDKYFINISTCTRFKYSLDILGKRRLTTQQSTMCQLLPKAS